MAKIVGIKGIQKTIDNLKERANYLARSAVEEISRDMELDAQKNFNRFAREVSADDRFVSVHRDKMGDYEATIICQGNQVLFIEFGVGIMNDKDISGRYDYWQRPIINGIYPYNELGFYGKRRGKDDFWVRPAKYINRSAGETSVHDKNGNVRQGVAWTKGHRPARALWRSIFSALQKYKERIGRFK